MGIGSLYLRMGVVRVFRGFIRGRKIEFLLVFVIDFFYNGVRE